jgi:pyruvate dehydrogenase E2 component (dihydrolipoamide acetyltransferase)
MPIELVMPKLGLNMEEGLLVEWLKSEGDLVRKNDPLFVVETEKVTNDYLATSDGILLKILVQGGNTVPVRTVVGLMATEGESLADLSSHPAQFQTTGNAPAAPITKLEAAPTAGGGERILATPVAKRIARENNIDLATVKGTGPEGRIGQEDIERVIKEREASKISAAGLLAQTTLEAVIPIEGIRAIIAERMLKSISTTAQLTLNTEVDATELVAWRTKLRKESESSGKSAPTYNAVLISIAAKALRAHPRLNAKQTGNAIHLLENINIGLAVDTEYGLVVVVVKDANEKSISEISSEIDSMAERATSKKSTIEDLTGGTFTITNLGGYGIDHFNPIINPPEMAILGIGRILEKLVISEGKVMQRHMLSLSLTFDHRLVDGGPAAQFLKTVGALIEGFGE